MLLLALALSLATATADDSCLDGWLPSGELCYRFHSRELDWGHSKAECELSDARLAEPKTIDAHRFVSERARHLTAAGDFSYWWIGANNFASFENSTAAGSNFAWARSDAVLSAQQIHWARGLKHEDGSPACVGLLAIGSEESAEEQPKTSEDDANWFTFDCRQALPSFHTGFVCERPPGDVVRVVSGGMLMKIDGDSMALDAESMSPDRFAERNFWPNGVVPLLIDDSYNAQWRSRLQHVLRHVEHAAGCDRLTFVDYNANAHNSFLHVMAPEKRSIYSQEAKSVCASEHVGHMGGEQEVLVGVMCKPGDIMHELLHAIGVPHEHQRPDRDQFIKINSFNIEPGKEFQFLKINATDKVWRDVPYDYDSIMHYGGHAFRFLPTINTIETLDGRAQRRIGQRKRLSDSDIRKLANLYPCRDEASTPVPDICPTKTLAPVTVWSTQLLTTTYYDIVNLPPKTLAATTVVKTLPPVTLTQLSTVTKVSMSHVTTVSVSTKLSTRIVTETVQVTRLSARDSLDDEDVSLATITHRRGFSPELANLILEDVKVVLLREVQRASSLLPIRNAIRKAMAKRFATMGNEWHVQVADRSEDDNAACANWIRYGFYKLHIRASSLFIVISRPRGQLPPASLQAEENFPIEISVFSGEFFKSRQNITARIVREAISRFNKKSARTKHIHDRLKAEHPTSKFSVYYGDSQCFKHRLFTFSDGIEVVFGPHELTIVRWPKTSASDLDADALQVTIRNGFSYDQGQRVLQAIKAKVRPSTSLVEIRDGVEEAVNAEFGPPDRKWNVQVHDISNGEHASCSSRVQFGQYRLDVQIDSRVSISVSRPAGEEANSELYDAIETEPQVEVFAGQFFKSTFRQTKVKSVLLEAIRRFQDKNERTKHVRNELRKAYGGRVQVFYGDKACFKSRLFTFTCLPNGIEVTIGLHEFTITRS